MHLVDLATGACAPQNNLLHWRVYPAARRLAEFSRQKLCLVSSATPISSSFHFALTHTPPTRRQHGMAPPNTRARANWAMERATALPEVWALVVKHRGVLGARRLMRVCKARERGGWSI